MVEAYNSSIQEGHTIEETCISPSDCLYKNNDSSNDMSIEGTINGASEPKEGLELSLDILDAFQQDELSPRLKNVLSAIINSIENLHGLITTQELQGSKRTPSACRIPWKVKLELAEFRIAEHGGRISQKDLQKNLEIRSRTTMTFLVNQLRSTGRYSVSKRGRCNFIEMIK
jgi:hypothetical protein